MDKIVGPGEVSSPVERQVSLRTRRRLLLVLAALAAGITLGPLPAGLLDASHALARSFGSWWPGVPAGRPTRTETERVLNVLVPALLVVAIAAAWPTVRAHRLLTGALAASLFIEAAQLVLPGRHSQVRDVVLNATGAAVGVLLVAVTRRWSPPRP